jgi:hypothetical protein
LKIVGVISDYKEAESIEDIVKVFVVEKRISTILSDSRNKDLHDVESKTIMLPTENEKELKTPNGEIPPNKEPTNQKPLFNVRGFN